MDEQGHVGNGRVLHEVSLYTQGIKPVIEGVSSCCMLRSHVSMKLV